jgi:hypothetical protein
MSPADAALVAFVRAEAAAPGAVIVAVKGRVAIFPEDIVGKSDDELLSFIEARLAERIPHIKRTQ